LLDPQKVKDHKIIRFIDEHYRDKFYLPNGAEVTVTYQDGSSVTRACSYIDAYHFDFGIHCFHICQFAELLEKNGGTATPSQFVTDPDMYIRKYPDRSLLDGEGKCIPYIEFYTMEDREDRYGLAKLSISWCNNADKSKTFCIYTKKTGEDGIAIPVKTYASYADLESKLDNAISNSNFTIELTHLDRAFIRSFAQVNSLQNPRQMSLDSCLKEAKNTAKSDPKAFYRSTADCRLER